jgi:hypothetical protein
MKGMEDMETTADQPDQAPLNWLQTWRAVLLHPNARTFTRIANDPKAGLKWAFLWMAVTSILTWFFGPQGSTVKGWGMTFFGPKTGLILLVIGALVAPLLGGFALLLEAGISHGLARLTGGTASFRRLVFCWAVLSTPFALLAGLVALFPALFPRSHTFQFSGVGLFVQVITLVLLAAVYLYQFYACVVAFGALEGFGFWKSLGLILVQAVVLGIALPCLASGFQSILRQILTMHWPPW